MKKAVTVDDYIAQFPAATQKVLKQMRKLITKNAPAAEESISYGMPAYKLNGPLVYFAGYENHVGLYATPSGHAAFKRELSVYKTGKGSVQFPLDEPLPADLITRIVQFRLKENELKGKTVKSKKQ
jgi:uncharacterized protein YdhG (YjbR/CyaY superfamily)